MKNISIIGSGIMGTGITQTFARSGYNVQWMDTSEDNLKKGLAAIHRSLDRQIVKQLITEEDKLKILNNIEISTNMQRSVKNADLVIEAVYEDLSVKLALFRDLDKYCKVGAILATNTSSISISTLAESTNRADRVIGMHFMNPVPISKLVEVVKGKSTSDEVIKNIVTLSQQLDKTPIVVNDYPGFVANRIIMPMINEAIYTLQDGVTGVIEIDKVIKLGMAHPMGPLQLADFIGLDICLAILKVLKQGFGDTKYDACPLLAEMVQAGNLGIKTGCGFYDYTLGNKDLLVSQQFKK